MNPGSQSQLGSHTIMQRTAAVVFLGSADILSAPWSLVLCESCSSSKQRAAEAGFEFKWLRVGTGAVHEVG